jgi:hypothetical protein
MRGFSTVSGGGSLPIVSLNPLSNAYPAGHHLGDSNGLSHVDTHLIPANILYGIEIFGVLGTATQWIYDLWANQALPAPLVADNGVISSQTTVLSPVSSQTINDTDSVNTLAQISLVVAAEGSGPNPLLGGISHKQTGPADTDETAATNNATANDMDLIPATGNATGDGFYFGMTGTFTGLTVNVGTPGVGTYTISWQYWNGVAFVNLPGANILLDTTNNWKTAGLVNLRIIPPGDWAATTIASITAYYLKALCTFTSLTTQPKGTQAWSNDS